MTVPTTGVYQFYVASDDLSRLYVSPNHKLEDAVVVARVDGWTASQEWAKEAGQKSEDIPLKKGQILAIYGVMQEGGGGDHLAIAVTGPGIPNITLIDEWVTHIAPTITSAIDPSPADGADDVIRDSVLSWTPGAYASKHNVYVGASLDEVESATVPTASGLDTSSLWKIIFPLLNCLFTPNAVRVVDT